MQNSRSLKEAFDFRSLQLGSCHIHFIPMLAGLLLHKYSLKVHVRKKMASTSALQVPCL